MKIYFFHSNMRSGGIERTIQLLSSQLVLYNVEVKIITIDDEDSFYPISNQIDHIKLSLSSNSRGKLNALINNYKRIFALRRCLKKYKPDVLLTFGVDTQLIGYLAKIGLKIKLIGAERSNPFLHSSGFWCNIKRFISRKCDGFLFQTVGASTYYPTSVKEKSLVVPNGIDPNIFEKYDIPWTERVNICAVGRMDDDKCFEDIIRTFAIVHQNNSSVKLDLYGDGPARSELELLVKSLSLNDSVVFHGRKSNIFEEYSSHKIFIMMSRQEGYPNVLLEAMASGCVCISTDCNFGPSEMIIDSVNGFLVPIHHFNMAAEKIIYALENDDKSFFISEQAKKVRKTNDVKHICNVIYEYLISILK